MHKQKSRGKPLAPEGEESAFKLSLLPRTRRGKFLMHQCIFPYRVHKKRCIRNRRAFLMEPMARLRPGSGANELISAYAAKWPPGPRRTAGSPSSYLPIRPPAHAAQSRTALVRRAAKGSPKPLGPVVPGAHWPVCLIGPIAGELGFPALAGVYSGGTIKLIWANTYGWCVSDTYTMNRSAHCV